ncbi:MAG: FKBP-type peptidyl-prolyl cis-trans isomerase [Bacteroidota bacterium]
MHRVVVMILGSLLWIGACDQASSSEEGQQTAPEKVQTVEESTPEVSASDIKEKLEVPYVIQDSSQVLTLQDGLEVYFIEKGTGPSPSIQRNVLFHYHGMLTDGTVFDSSFERGQPLDSPLSRLIRGWQIALEQVPLGSKVKLVIPPELGYGAQGSTNVPPNATLIFDIELISMY